MSKVFVNAYDGHVDGLPAVDYFHEPKIQTIKQTNGDSRRTHEIKLSREFQDAVLCGEKSFEVRYNDRGYQKGDLVKFHVTDRRNIVEPLDSKVYEITYVLSGWHIEQDYVVFGIREVEHD